MKNDTRQAFRDLGYYSSLGFSVALAVFIGVFLGIFLDSWLGTHPILMFVGLGLGIAAGFRNIFHAMARVSRADSDVAADDKEDKNKKENKDK